MRSTTIPQEVLTVLSVAVIIDNVVKLQDQLERPLYEATNKVLVALGGKWNRTMKGHVFQNMDPTDVLDQAIMTGRYEKPQDFGFFPTPDPIVFRLMRAAEIEPGMSCLEPSAGVGAIADDLAKIVGHKHVKTCELWANNCEILRSKGFSPIQDDFLATSRLRGLQFDRIVMNPPFARQQDIDHVREAFWLLKPGGRLVSVMSIGFTFRSDKKATAFRELVDNVGCWSALPEDAFKESGTMVRTVMVILDREEAA